MVYKSKEQMDSVMGKFEDNQFIQNEFKQSDLFKKSVNKIIRNYCTNPK